MLSSSQSAHKIVVRQEMDFGPIDRPSRYMTYCDFAGRATRKVIECSGKKFGCVYLFGEIDDESMTKLLVTEN